MAGDCNVAGSIISSGACFISINTSSSTESKIICTQTIPLVGPTIETVTITGYATKTIHIGEAGRAGYSSTLTRKYDCNADSVRFLCNGEGSSYVMGNVGGLASITGRGVSTGGFSCSAASGPASICLYSTQENGFGMSYGGSPISFSSSQDACTMINLSIGSISGKFYLQSFSLDMPSGQVPVASYTVTRVVQKK
jgi:hypothetical protein